MNEMLLPQLYAMRMLIEGVIVTLERARDAEVSSLPDACPHPADRQVNATVMGGPPMVLCMVCGEQRIGTAPTQ